MDFNLVDLVLRIRCDDISTLARYLYSSGGEFAQFCRTVACRWPGRDCRVCSAACDCGWHLVFGQELTTDPEALRRHQKPPLPFSFSFPVAGSTCVSDELVCGLVVAGTAIPYLEMLLTGFAAMLKELCGQLAGVSSCDYHGMELALGNGSSIAQPGNLVVLSSRGILESRPWGSQSLLIGLRSPLRLVSNGRQQRRFEFSTFARNLLRRVSAMAYYYGQCRMDQDFRALSHLAEQVVCDEYVFTWGRSGSAAMSGLTGHGRFSGNFTELIPFLVLGSYLHAGKGAAFGFGSFELGVE